MTNLVAYTWAKSIDLSSERGNGDRGGGFGGSGDERNRAGSSAVFPASTSAIAWCVSSVFELPFGTGKALMANAGPDDQQDRRRLGGELHRHRPGRFPVHRSDVGGHQRRRHHRIGPTWWAPSRTTPAIRSCYVVDSRNAEPVRRPAALS